VPKVDAESRNVTVPVAIPENGGVTVALNMTDCPKIDGLSELLTAVALLALFTV
jgi:hypothetical protein